MLYNLLLWIRGDKTGAKALMIQGAGFGMGVGKSLVCAILCKIFDEDGYREAPYKTLNEDQIGKRILGYIPYFEELSQLPDLDPITLSPRFPMGTWKELIGKISKRSREGLDLKQIYYCRDLIKNAWVPYWKG